MTQLILIRHGQSQWNLENRFTGFVDVPLTAAGEAEARDAGAKLRTAGIQPTHLFTSTLSRAWHTADLVQQTAGLNLPATRHDDLRERNYGDLAGLNKKETAEKYGEEQVHLWRRSYDVRPPGGESLADVVARVRPYYTQHILPLLDAGETVMVVSHGNTQRALLIILGLNTPENIQAAEVPNGTPMVVTVDDGKATSATYL